jgi:hypothetical protein
MALNGPQRSGRRCPFPRVKQTSQSDSPTSEIHFGSRRPLDLFRSTGPDVFQVSNLGGYNAAV